MLDSESRCKMCRLFPLPFRRLRYLWDYSDCNVRALISVMKYRPSIAAAMKLGDFLARNLLTLFDVPDWDLIVPMPISKQSMLERNFNQCAYLSRVLQKASRESRCVKVRQHALVHMGYKAVQASLNHGDRCANVRRAFKASNEVYGQNVLLVEDVVTTGATVAASCMALLRAGALSVDILAIARAAAWDEYRYAVYRELTRATA